MKRPFAIRFFVGMALYAVTLLVSTSIVARISDQPATFFLALLPIVPLLFAMMQVYNGVRSQDELIRLVNLESVLVAALATAALTFSWGLLEEAGVIPRLPVILVGPMMVMIWGIALAINTRRYS